MCSDKKLCFTYIFVRLLALDFSCGQTLLTTHCNLCGSVLCVCVSVTALKVFILPRSMKIS